MILDEKYLKGALSPMKLRSHKGNLRSLQTRPRLLLLLLFLSFFCSSLQAEDIPKGAEVPDDPAYEECILRLGLSGRDMLTLGEIRRRCRRVVQASDQVDKRFRREEFIEQEEFVITPHKPNYILLGAYNFGDVNTTPFPQEEAEGFKQAEVKFQLSFKIPVLTGLFSGTTDLYAAYTNRSFWQLYAWDFSAPFRESNHEPEAWFRVKTRTSILGLRLDSINLGGVHQSNGRGGEQSRSWNRLYAQVIFSRGNFGFAVKPWLLVGDLSDNPDISDYMGHFEFQSAYKAGRHTIALMLRNNLDFSDNHGALQLEWSFPLFGHFRGYTQWFYGYGESLIDYDAKVNSLGLGVQLTDWF